MNTETKIIKNKDKEYVVTGEFTNNLEMISIVDKNNSIEDTRNIIYVDNKVQKVRINNWEYFTYKNDLGLNAARKTIDNSVIESLNLEKRFSDEEYHEEKYLNYFQIYNDNSARLHIRYEVPSTLSYEHFIKYIDNKKSDLVAITSKGVFSAQTKIYGHQNDHYERLLNVFGYLFPSFNKETLTEKEMEDLITNYNFNLTIPSELRNYYLNTYEPYNETIDISKEYKRILKK